MRQDHEILRVVKFWREAKTGAVNEARDGGGDVGRISGWFAVEGGS